MEHRITEGRENTNASHNSHHQSILMQQRAMHKEGCNWQSVQNMSLKLVGPRIGHLYLNLLTVGSGTIVEDVAERL